ncbi:MAG: hypothetical protein Q8K28_06425 [Hoeflea sp.]|uniref:hypothetical protein n=1 Tax=Hoeflea sp. TaxID=1940281 RepID=UPI00272FE73B|nr:hypothetical protein [Hoeflea sp.]MDP2119523.1 hypothetical protein [Hoeflea sp.]
MKNNSLYSALEQFEAIEANLAKLQRLSDDISGFIPTGISFGSNPLYEDKLRAAEAIVEHMPAIDGWRLTLEFFDLETIAQTRLDLAELMELNRPGFAGGHFRLSYAAIAASSSMA